MLREEITYEDYNGEKVTDVFYFNLSKAELMEMEMSEKGGWDQTIKRIVEARDGKTLISIFKELILEAYGEKSEDGRRFIKNDQLRKEFEQSAAYSELFMKLATDDGYAVKWIQGVLPADMAEQIAKSELETKGNMPQVPKTT